MAYGPDWIGFQMSRIIAEIEKKPRISSTTAETGTTFFMSIRLPRTFSISGDRDVPAVQRREREQVESPMNSTTVANSMKYCAHAPCEPA